jgi:hypothetical protein
MMRRLSLVGLGLCVILLSSVSQAWAFRCGTRIVSNGDTKTEVRLKCGEPAFIDERAEDVVDTYYDGRERRYRTRYLVEITEEWTYNRGPHQLIHILRFRQGRLVDIKTAGYGS